MNLLNLLFAATPLLVFLGLILLLHRSVLLAAGAALLAQIVIGAGLWGMTLGRLATASAKGGLIASEIILIVFGALFILELLREQGRLSQLQTLFLKISADQRVQVLLIAWALVHFIEGVAGFGTPAMIAIPILLALGFPALLAVALPLIGDTMPVIFGAIGLPVTYGIGAAIGASPEVVREITLLAAGLNILLSLLVPVLLVFALARFQKKPHRYWMEMVPFALLSGLAVSVPAFIVARYLGPELPSVIGGLVGLVLISLLAWYRVLLPDTVGKSEEIKGEEAIIHPAQLFLTVLPFLLVVVLLLVSRAPFLPVQDWLRETLAIRLPAIGSYALNYTFAPLYAAGPLMIAAGGLSFLILSRRREEAAAVIGKTLAKLKRPYLSLIVVLAFVQSYLYSSENVRDLPAMPLLLAEALGGQFGGIWPLLAPAVGALGSFTTGSATVSNLIFSGFQQQTALTSGHAMPLILTLQGLGAAAGNMIAPHNIIAALAVAGQAGDEGKVMRYNLPLLVVYLIVLGVVGVVAGLWR